MPRTPTGSVLIKATDRTKKVFKGIIANLKKIGGALTGFKAKIALAVGAGGLGLMVSKSLKAIDTIGKLSRTYGIATEDLGAFQIAAELGGTSLATFTKAARQVSKNVFDFVVRNTGEAKDAFKALGITVDDLRPIMNDNVATIGLVSEKLNELKDGSIKTAVAYKILGGRAIELLPALKGGAAAFAEYKREALEFGTAMSSDAVTGVEKANDAITRLKFLFKGLTDQTVAALAPALQEGVDKFREMIQGAIAARGGIREFARDMAVAILEGFRRALEGVQEFIKGLEKVKQFLIEIGAIDNSQQEQRIAFLDGQNERMQETINHYSDTADKVAAHKKLTEELAASIKTNEAELIRLRGQGLSLTDKSIKMLDVFIAKLKEKNEAEGGAAGGGLGQGSGDALGNATAPESFRNASVGPGIDAGLGERVAALRTTMLTEKELIEQSILDENLLIDEAWKTRAITTRERNELMLSLRGEHEKRLTGLEKKGWTERQKFAALTVKKQAQTVLGELTNITAGVAQHNRKLFEINKIAAIASAIVNTHEGVTRTLAKYPQPLAGIMAAAHLAAGIAQVRAIRSQSFGGSAAGGGSIPSQATSPGIPVTPTNVTPIRQEQTAPAITLNFHGPVTGDERLRQTVIDAIKEGSDLEELTISIDGQTAQVY